MSRKTEGVKILVQDALQNFSEPYGEDIIRDVCLQIEGDADLKRRYDELKEAHKKDVVNNWIGKYTKELTGLKSLREVPAGDDVTIIASYTKLRDNQ